MYLFMQTTNKAFTCTKDLVVWIIITPYNSKSQEWFYLFIAAGADWWALYCIYKNETKRYDLFHCKIIQKSRN